MLLNDGYAACMTTPRSDRATSDSAKSAPAKSDTKATKMSPADAARAELHGATPGMPTIAMVFGDDLFEQWVAQIKTDDRYALADPDNPNDTSASTNSSGANPPPALIVQYGDGQNDYISTVFDAGQVIVQDGNDPTGKAWKFPESGWRRFVARVRGEEVPPEEGADGPSQYEEAALFQERTNKAVQADRDANSKAADRRANESK